MAVRDSEKGSILLLVLWVIAIIAVITTLFIIRAKVSVKNTAFIKYRTEGFSTLHGAIQRAVYDTLIPPATDDPDMLNRIVTRFEYTIDGWEVIVEKIPLSSKLSIQNVRLEDWKKVFQTYGLDEVESMAVISSIQDWTDSDNLIRIDGAEDDYYQDLDFPYYAKNDKIENIKELLLIKGITEEMFYGGDSYPPLTDFFTVYETSGKLDINTASPSVIQAFLELEEDDISELISIREETPIENITELTEILDANSYSLAIQHFSAGTKDSIVSLKAYFKDGSQNSTLTEIYELNRNKIKKLETKEWDF